MHFTRPRCLTPLIPLLGGKMQNKEIILASSSPRRIEILKMNDINPIIMPPHVDETIPDGLSMEQAVMYLALLKALSVEKEWLKSEPSNPDKAYIIAADTVVYKDRIIGKPEDFQDARNIFNELKNTSHLVTTGVAIIQAKSNNKMMFCEITEVFFKDYNEGDIIDYLKTPEPWDKAGGYAIQGGWAKHISHIKGDYNNVVGFPWARIEKELNKM